jgi:transcription antitermination factor NusG
VSGRFAERFIFNRRRKAGEGFLLRCSGRPDLWRQIPCTEIAPYVGFAWKNFEMEDCDIIQQLLVKHPGKHWSLVQTRPRNEKYAAQCCREQGIIVYLPLITKVEKHNRSVREFQLPMFPGYFFACPGFEEESLIRRDKCVYNLKVLSDCEEDRLLRDLLIVRESEILSVNHKLVVNPKLSAGDVVQFKKGPFRNYDVRVVKRADETRVVVDLEFLGRSLMLTCNADELIY